MAVTAAQAHSIFSGVVLGQEEAFTALAALADDETAEYGAHVESFTNKLGEIEIEASLEMGSLVDAHQLQTLPDDRRDWSIGHYRDLLDAIEDSKFEALHICMSLQVDNRKALLALVKP